MNELVTYESEPTGGFNAVNVKLVGKTGFLRRILIVKTGKLANQIADALNEAYHKGRKRGRAEALEALREVAEEDLCGYIEKLLS